MADKYASFAELAASEPKTSYAITVRDRRTTVAVIGPHGGGIEPGTSEIAAAIAGDDYSLYLFEGVKVNSNGDLHITSTHFDEPSCLSLLASARLALTIHGEQSLSETICVGGRHREAVTAISDALEKSDFQVREHPNSELHGLDTRNICNRGTGGSGVQLELSRGLRRSLFTALSRAGRENPTPKLSRLGAAVRLALSKIGL
jgi:phage replication-related protein YjqB (UPF0714/DUF867 family)